MLFVMGKNEYRLNWIQNLKDNLKSDLEPVCSCYYIIVGKAPERQPTSFSKFPIILLKFRGF